MVDSKQMEMAFMREGGIKDDGMKKDPVSGNDIPPGSMASEVRDDIPAMLSEGEYVVPADVLRYYGVNFFENLRNKAKQGLQGMEADGRIGGEPLTPQQIQKNMGAAPQAGVTAPMPVQAADGVLTQGQQQSNFQPQNYSTVGFSTMQPSASVQQESITTFKTWVNAQTGEIKVIEYIDGRPKVEEPESPPFYEYGSSALKKAQAQIQSATDSGGDDNGPTAPSGGETKATDTSWMDGIDFNDASSISKAADNILGLGSGLEKGALGLAGMAAGLPGMAIAKTALDGADVAKLKALEQYTRVNLKDEKTADSIKGKIDKALESNKVLGWLNKTFPELITGKKSYDQIIMRTDTTDDGVYNPGGIDVALGRPQGDDSGDAFDAAVAASRAKSAANKAAMEEAQASGASTEDIAGLREAYEKAGGTWATGGRARGGLMTKNKKKKK